MRESGEMINEFYDFLFFFCMNIRDTQALLFGVWFRTQGRKGLIFGCVYRFLSLRLFPDVYMSLCQTYYSS